MTSSPACLSNAVEKPGWPRPLLPTRAEYLVLVVARYSARGDGSFRLRRIARWRVRSNLSFDASSQLNMDAIARSEIPTRLGEADDGPAGLQFLAGDAVVAVALDVNSRFSRFRRIVKPDFAAASFRVRVIHCVSSLLESAAANCVVATTADSSRRDGRGD